MTTFKQWDIVKVPFPYTDKTTNKRRPALVVSNEGLRENHGLVWVVMITSAKNARWPSDVEIEDYEKCGLPAPSIIRPCKIATIDADLILGRLGSFGNDDCVEIRNQIHKIIAS